GAEAQRAGGERRELGRLAVLLDDAAGRAAAEENRGRTLQHLDVVEEEGIAVIAAEIPHAVEVDVAARAKTADRQIVALRAVLAGAEADAGDVAQGVAHRRNTLVFHDLARHRVNRSRRIEQRL